MIGGERPRGQNLKAVVLGADRKDPRLVRGGRNDDRAQVNGEERGILLREDGSAWRWGSGRHHLRSTHSGSRVTGPTRRPCQRSLMSKVKDCTLGIAEPKREALVGKQCR